MTKKVEKCIELKFKRCYNELITETNDFLLDNEKIYASKSNDKFLKFKNEGNKLYKAKELKSAHHCYNQALVFAEYNSENYGIALANRSAVFFERNKYKECLLDIEECMHTKYPEERRFKLFDRIQKCEERIEDMKDKSPNDKTGLPEFIENKNIFGASASVEIAYSNLEGRHIIALKDLNPGDILFVEPAFALAPIFNSLEELKDTKKCSRCLKYNGRATPCKSCSICVYCCSKCRDDSWIESHRWECVGMKYGLWYKIGLGFPAFRALVKGISSKFETLPNIREAHVKFGNHYKYFDSLESHLEDMEDETLENICAISAQIVRYLELKTDFFKYLVQAGVGANSEQIGYVLVKHMAQLSCNASVVEHWPIPIDNIDQFIDKASPVASAIYPTVSLMNHSCKPNIALYFMDNHVIVKCANRISAGQQICNSYGIDYRFSEKQERQEHLKELYYFECDCRICCDDSKEFRNFDSILCPECKGRVCLPIKDLEFVTICYNCNATIENFATFKNDLVVVKSPDDNVTLTHEINLTNYRQLFHVELHRGEYVTALAHLSLYLECLKSRVGEYHIDCGIALFKKLETTTQLIFQKNMHPFKSFNEYMKIHDVLENYLKDLKMIFKINYPYSFKPLSELQYSLEVLY